MSIKLWNAETQTADNLIGSRIENNIIDDTTASTDKVYSSSKVEDIIKEVYSTEEVKTNKVWIDGKPIYRCVVKRSTVGDIDLTSLNIDEMIDVSGYLLSSSTSRMPLCYYENANYYCHWSWANVRKTIVFVQAGNTAYSPTVIVEYTKTTD